MEKIGDIWGRKMALLAWKLDGRGTVVDEVVVLGNGVVGGSVEVYQRVRGRNNKYTSIIAIQIQDKATHCWRCSNEVLIILVGAGIYPGMSHQYRVIIGQMIRRGKAPCLQC